jgi:hypothetical protein
VKKSISSKIIYILSSEISRGIFFYVEVKKSSFSFACDMRGSIAWNYSLMDRGKKFSKPSDFIFSQGY